MKLRLVLASFAALLAAPVFAETVACPDPVTLMQVGTCPSEEELQFTFTGYCSDNARVYDKPEKQLCTNYELYRAMKNFALWETRDGRFNGYLSCDPGKLGIEGARPASVKIDKQGSVTRLFCGYSTGITLTYRTKAKCVAEAADCANNPSACQANCE